MLVIIIFSAVYFVFSWLRGERAFDLREYFRDTYRNGITNSYWYLYLYAAILVMMPILQRLAKGLKTADYKYIFIWSFAFLGTMPIIVHYFPELEYNTAFALPIFSVYLGLLFAGLYIHKKLGCEKRLLAVSVAVFCVTAILR